MRIQLMLALIGLASCTAVRTDFDRSVDFEQYKTFDWLPADVQTRDNPEYKSGLINTNIKSTVEAEFAKRDIRVSKRNPDFLVGYHTFTKEKTRTYYDNRTFYPYGLRGRWYFSYPYWGWPSRVWSTTPRTETYTEGTLIVDVIDNHSKELIWRGSIAGDVDNIARLQKRIEKGVAAILKKYPVQPVKGNSDAADPAATIK